MSKHTPTPWAMSPYNSLGVFDSQKRCIAVAFSDISSYDIELEEREANAAYIVTCVNSHDQLLAERDALLVATAKLREALAKFTSHYDCEDCWYSCATLTCNEGRKSDVCDCGAQTAIDALSLPTPSVQK